MFWGLIMEPGRCYTQSVKVSFHISMAALDMSSATVEPVQVMCILEGRNYLLCTLNKQTMLQCPLDLNFETGSKVSFATNGKSHVHLTGYLISEDELLEEEETEELSVTTKDKKRLTKESLGGPPTKKSKVAAVEEEAEAESSDSDFDIAKLMGAGNEDGEEASDEEASDEEEEEEDDAAEEQEANEEVSSLSEEEVTEEEEVKPKLNGITKPTKKTREPEKRKEKMKKEKQQEEQPKARKTVLEGGVIIQDIKEGTGEPVKKGKFVHVYYEGRLKDNNKVFDSANRGPGFKFRLSRGEVIKGWDIGVPGMKIGGKRRIICPPNVAYGAKGSPPVIPPNSTLVFDVELKRSS